MTRDLVLLMPFRRRETAQIPYQIIGIFDADRVESLLDQCPQPSIPHRKLPASLAGG
jgi:hypothetical protein